MPSAYLQSGDLATYGVPSATPAQIAQASTLIDAYLKRPEGLIWAPDASGVPCYMTALSPTYTFKLNGSIAPGANVVAALAGPVAQLQAGDVLVLDRATAGSDANVAEGVVVVATNGVQVTLQNVQFEHADASLAEYGLQIEEQKNMPPDRPLTFLSKGPLVQVLSGVGRYAYGRRGDDNNYNLEQFNLLAAVSKYGGPPAWEIFNPLNTGYDANTGQLWIPAGVLLAYYTEVKLRYVAGFTYATLPGAVKNACASIIQALGNLPQMGNIKSYRAGDTAIEMAAASKLDQDTMDELNAYRARLFA